MRIRNALREVVWLSWIALGLVIGAIICVTLGDEFEVALILVLSAGVLALLRS